MLKFLMLSILNFSQLFSLKIGGTDYYRMIHSSLLSFQYLFEKTYKIKNFHINAYSKGVNNREKKGTSLVP